MTPSSFARPGLWLIVSWLMIAAEPLCAAAGGFTATLSSEQKTAAGLTALAEDERTALDQLVADDLAFARRESLTDLGNTFLARRTEADRKQAGLDRLTPEQLGKLNELVAAAIAARPTPKERPRLKESDVLAAKRRGEIHGSVTVAYGWGRGGRDYRASSLWLDYYDPESRVGIGVGISVADGGYYGYYPGSYGYYPGYYDSWSYSPSRVYSNTSYRGDSFGSGGSFSDGSCLSVSPGQGFGRRGGGRGR